MHNEFDASFVHVGSRPRRTQLHYQNMTDRERETTRCAVDGYAHVRQWIDEDAAEGAFTADTTNELIELRETHGHSEKVMLAQKKSPRPGRGTSSLKTALEKCQPTHTFFENAKKVRSPSKRPPTRDEMLIQAIQKTLSRPLPDPPRCTVPAWNGSPRTGNDVVHVMPEVSHENDGPQTSVRSPTPHHGRSIVGRPPLVSVSTEQLRCNLLALWRSPGDGISAAMRHVRMSLLHEGLSFLRSRPPDQIAAFLSQPVAGHALFGGSQLQRALRYIGAYSPHMIIAAGLHPSVAQACRTGDLSAVQDLPFAYFIFGDSVPGGGYQAFEGPLLRLVLARLAKDRFLVAPTMLSEQRMGYGSAALPAARMGTGNMFVGSGLDVDGLMRVPISIPLSDSSLRQYTEVLAQFFETHTTNGCIGVVPRGDDRSSRGTADRFTGLCCTIRHLLFNCPFFTNGFLGRHMRVPWVDFNANVDTSNALAFSRLLVEILYIPVAAAHFLHDDGDFELDP